MKKKTELSGVIVAVILVLLIAVAAGVIWVVIQKMLEPQYIIYEKECHNIYSCTFPVEKGREVPCYDSQGSIMLNQTCFKEAVYHSWFSEENKSYCNFDQEVCEQVEVERIPVGWKHKEGICNVSDFTIINEKTNYGECVWIYPEQITIEWLEENCECVFLIGENGMSCINPTNYEPDWDKIDKDCSKLMKAKNSGKCFQYKCGEYIVEVKK